MINIPLTSDPEQIFSININGATYDVRVLLNSRTGIWSLELSQNGITLISNIALLGGIDNVKQYNLGISNMYTVNLDNPNLDPSKTNLGTVARLYILTDEEVANV